MRLIKRIRKLNSTHCTSGEDKIVTGLKIIADALVLACVMLGINAFLLALILLTH